MKRRTSPLLAVVAALAVGSTHAQELSEDLLDALELECSQCYPGPDAFPGPPLSPPPTAFPGTRLPRLSGGGGAYLVTEEASVTAARQLSVDGLCTAILRRLFDPQGSCPAESRVQTATYLVAVSDGGEAFPVFLMQIAGKSELLAKYQAGAFESHRYYFTYMMDLDGNLQLLLFGYEPLYNRGGDYHLVLDRNQPNTYYIPVTSDDKLNDLNNVMRDTIQRTLGTLVAGATE